jgi:hypothetical protein
MNFIKITIATILSIRIGQSEASESTIFSPKDGISARVTTKVSTVGASVRYEVGKGKSIRFEDFLSKQKIP